MVAVLTSLEVLQVLADFDVSATILRAVLEAARLGLRGRGVGHEAVVFCLGRAGIQVGCYKFVWNFEIVLCLGCLSK